MEFKSVSEVFSEKRSLVIQDHEAESSYSLEQVLGLLYSTETDVMLFLEYKIESMILEIRRDVVAGLQHLEEVESIVKDIEGIVRGE